MPDHIPTRAGIDLIRDAAQDAAEGSLVSVRKDLLQAFAARLNEAERLLRENLYENPTPLRWRQSVRAFLGAE